MNTAPQADPPAGYQPGGHAWIPGRPDIDLLLSTARHAQTRPIYYGSNHTFLVTLDAGDAGQSLAVYKPARGEYPLYDFATGTLYRREIGAYLVARLLGWDVVPPTVVTSGKYGRGSLQLFIESVESAEVAVDDLRRIALLDIVLNNADRKAEHCLVGHDDHIWAIDHGLTFHAQYKLRTVLWYFAGDAFTESERSSLNALLESLLACTDADSMQLHTLLTSTEWRALRLRTERLVARGAFSDPPQKTVPYRW